MSVSRRELFRLGARASGANVPLITARGREALVDELGPLLGEFGPIPPPQEGEIRISSNENPLGPPSGAVAAIRESFEEAGRYPTNAVPNSRDLTAALAEKHGCESENIVLGAGSGEILETAAHAFTSKYRPLVTGTPSYLQPVRIATYLGADVQAVPIFRKSGQLDLGGMAAAARGPSLIFVCNPNNPTSTVHSASDIGSFVEQVRSDSPNSVIHLDEAYHDYVTDPAYESGVALALETPNVFATRTFSKCFGMAGMRIGYGVGHRDVIATLRRYQLTFNTNTPGVGGAHAALQDGSFVASERARNSEAKQLTVDFFKGKGYDLYDSQTNFIFVDLGIPAGDFRSACAEHNVAVGRDFPPMEKTHSRISIGTSAEMQRAVEVFEEVLA